MRAAIIRAAFDLIYSLQRPFDDAGVTAIDGKLEADPALTMTFEILDITGTQRSGFCASIEFGRHFQIDIDKSYVLIQTVYFLFCRLAEIREH